MDTYWLLSLAFVGAGMFMLGWYAHAWAHRPPEAPAASRWNCPKCQRVKELPPELDGKVLVCNNCQVRLLRQV